jgi:hypothetical protein
MGQRGIQVVRERFSWESRVAETEAVLMRLV